ERGAAPGAAQGGRPTAAPDAPVAGANADPDRFRFAWPVPASVTVEARVEKRDNTSTARYRVDLSPAADGELALDFRNFEFVTLNGVDAREPQVAAQLGPVATLTALLPTMRISAAGEYLGTVGIADMLERVLAAVPNDMDAATRERLDEYFRSPQVQAMMQQKSGEVWTVWVGAWNGVELAAGESLTGTVPVAVMSHDLVQNVLVEHLGPAAGACANCVRLRMTTVMEGPEVMQLVAGMVRELAGDDQAGAFVSARSMNVTEVVTDPADLRPRFASSSAEVTLTDSSDQAYRQTDRREYRFDWR
ncbi:MAG: hypothetical protein ACU85V_18135, partial [Gammaproteobacteria bacterium]